MGNGDNRRSRKMIQRRQWRKLKARIRKKIEAAKGAAAPAAAPKKKK